MNFVQSEAAGCHIVWPGTDVANAVLPFCCPSSPHNNNLSTRFSRGWREGPSGLTVPGMALDTEWVVDSGPLTDLLADE